MRLQTSTYWYVRMSSTVKLFNGAMSVTTHQRLIFPLRMHQNRLPTGLCAPTVAPGVSLPGKGNKGRKREEGQERMQTPNFCNVAAPLNTSNQE